MRLQIICAVVCLQFGCRSKLELKQGDDQSAARCAESGNQSCSSTEVPDNTNNEETNELGSVGHNDAKLTKDDCIDPELSKVASDQTFMLCNGSVARGTLKVCETDGAVGCVTTSAVKAAVLGEFSASDIRVGKTIAGVAGTLNSYSSCSADGEVGCLANNDYPAVDRTNILNSSVIKKNVVVAGVTGDYPSSTFPLTGADATADLDIATFDAKIKNGMADFEWFDSAGNRYQKAGDSDIDSDNLKSGINIFGTPGNINPLTSADEWNIRAGVNVGSISGKLKVNCRNSTNLGNYDIEFPGKSAVVNSANETFTIPNHGFVSNQQVRLLYSTAPGGLSNANIYYVRLVDANTIELSTSSGPGPMALISSNGQNVSMHMANDGVINIWDTVDEFSASPGIQPGGWTNDTYCGGVELVPGDGNVWKDVTTSTCSGPSDQCRFKDKISGLEWSEFDGNIRHWGAAVQYCENLVHDGQSDWRLPTQKEAMDAYNHGIYSAAKTDWITGADMVNYFWTATTEGLQPDDAMVVVFASGVAFDYTKNQQIRSVCVR